LQKQKETAAILLNWPLCIILSIPNDDLIQALIYGVLCD